MTRSGTENTEYKPRITRTCLCRQAGQHGLIACGNIWGPRNDTKRHEKYRIQATDCTDINGLIACGNVKGPRNDTKRHEKYRIQATDHTDTHGSILFKGPACRHWKACAIRVYPCNPWLVFCILYFFRGLSWPKKRGCQRQPLTLSLVETKSLSSQALDRSGLLF